jgi:hypothetical protein
MNQFFLSYRILKEGAEHGEVYFSCNHLL